MNQSQHIEALRIRNDKRKNIADRIQDLYQDYVTVAGDSSEILEELFILLDTYCGEWVAKQLYDSSLSSPQFLEDINQESHKAIYQFLNKSQITGKAKEHFANYCFAIYKNKTTDHFRKISTIIRRTAPAKPDTNNGPSPDVPIKIQGTLPGVETHLIRSEDRKFYRQLYIHYCTALVTATAYPPRCLALYYARMLPHMIQMIKPLAVASSAKWAYQKMGNRTINSLSNASESFLQKKISPELSWCKEYRDKLGLAANPSEEFPLLRDLIYTSAYKMPKIEDWSDSMHKATIKSARKLIQKDPELALQLQEEYEDTGSKLLKHFIGGGK